jgi:hypothetical protein
MQRRRRSTIDDLRLAIDCLPEHTRRAMLDGIRSSRIIVGGYTDGEGGVCPMLAAHRRGGRTNAIFFARTWDSFTGASRVRRATERELRILERHLEQSLLDEAVRPLGEAIAEHRELVSRREKRERETIRTRPSVTERAGADRGRPGDADRGRELRHSAGWAWLRPVRRLDDYERALARLRGEAEAPAERELVLS